MFSVTNNLSYLGVFRGPVVESRNWSGPLRKYVERSLSIASSSPSPFTSADTYSSRAASCLSYVSQLHALPWDSSLEKRIIARILRFPYTALSLSGLFSLHLWGGIRIRSIAAAAVASQVRTALFTLNGWQSQLAQLRDVTKDDNADIDFFSYWFDRLSPLWWDTSPIAKGFVNIINGKSSISGIDRIVPQAIRRVLTAKAELDACNPGRSFRFQKQLTTIIQEEAFPDDIADTILKRVSKFYPDSLTLFTVDSLAELQTFSRSLPCQISFQLLRVWCNGLCTSARLHEPVRLPALCACAGESDTQQHYFDCVALQFLVADVFRASPPPGSAESALLISTLIPEGCGSLFPGEFVQWYSSWLVRSSVVLY